MGAGMSGPSYMIRPTPGGSSRDTYATFRMRQALRVIPRSSAAEVWAAQPMATRQRLAHEACGMRGLDLYALAWDAIPARDRMLIGAAARRMAEGLL